jgi:hypothetical protein
MANGGTYGIEGGAACTIALILSSLFLWRTHVLSATPEQLELTTQKCRNSQLLISELIADFRVLID